MVIKCPYYVMLFWNVFGHKVSGDNVPCDQMSWWWKVVTPTDAGASAYLDDAGREAAALQLFIQAQNTFLNDAASGRRRDSLHLDRPWMGIGNGFIRA